MSDYEPMTRGELNALIAAEGAIGDEATIVHGARTALAYLDRAEQAERELAALRVRLEEVEKLASALEQIADMPETEPWPTTSPELNWYSVVKHKSDLARKALAAWREKGSGS